MMIYLTDKELRLINGAIDTHCEELSQQMHGDGSDYDKERDEEIKQLCALQAKFFQKKWRNKKPL